MSFDTHITYIDIPSEQSRWDRPVTTLQVNGVPLTTVLHSYDSHLVFANDTDMIRFAISFKAIVLT